LSLLKKRVWGGNILNGTEEEINMDSKTLSNRIKLTPANSQKNTILLTKGNLILKSCEITIYKIKANSGVSEECGGWHG
jgi:hypothetical protein